MYIVAVLRGDSKITGTVSFEQASESAPTTISYDITGHDASAEVPTSFLLHLSFHET